MDQFRTYTPLLLLDLRRRPRFLAVSGVVLAAAPFWSAFVAVGLLPLVAVQGEIAKNLLTTISSMI